jgi:hypothetical protein
MEKIIEVNCETGEVIERELTADETAQRKIDLENAAAEAKAQEAGLLRAEAAIAKLAALGLDLDDLKSLGF